MDVVEIGVTSVREASQNWNILLTSLSNHVNDNITSRKHGPLSVLANGKEVAIVDWILGMQECGLLITLQQLKLKVINLPKPKLHHSNCGSQCFGMYY